MSKSKSFISYVFVHSELPLVILATAVTFYVFSTYAIGGPNSTDVIWYMNAGINGIKDVYILNRYFHVFFEAIFLNMARTPLIGLQQYWAFLITGICLLNYLIARTLSQNSRPLHGLLAIAFFFSTGIISDTSGLPLVDVTAMFMVLLIILVYRISEKAKHLSWFWIVLIGVIYFLGLKTKETVLPVTILFIGFAFTDNESDGRLILKRFGFLLTGVLIGILFFSILGWIFLRDALFGMRYIELKGFVDTYFADSQSYGKFSGLENWYTAVILNNLWIPFIFYAISGAKFTGIPSNTVGTRLIWLVPLGSIIFVTALIGNQWGYVPRFIYPALPIFCILAPQFLNFNLSDIQERRKQLYPLGYFFGGLIFMFIIRLLIRNTVLNAHGDIASFLAVIFTPVIFSSILAMVFIWKTLPNKASFLLSAIIISLVYIPISREITLVFINRPNQEFSARLVYPFSAFSDQIQFDSDMEIYISPDVWQEMETSNFLKDRIEIASLFNVFFDAGSTKHNFIVPEEPSTISDDLMKHDFTHVLLSASDWQEISAKPEIGNQLENKYALFIDDRNILVLLKPK